MPAAIIRTSRATKPGLVWFTDPDGHLNFARYSVGRWRGTNRYRGFVLEKRRSRAPYLSAGAVRVPVTVHPDHDPSGDVF